MPSDALAARRDEAGLEVWGTEGWTAGWRRTLAECLYALLCSGPAPVQCSLRSSPLAHELLAHLYIDSSRTDSRSCRKQGPSRVPSAEDVCMMRRMRRVSLFTADVTDLCICISPVCSPAHVRIIGTSAGPL